MFIFWYIFLDKLNFDILSFLFSLSLFPFIWVLGILLKIISTTIDLRFVLFIIVIMVENCDFDVSFQMQLFYLYLLVTLLLHLVIIIIEYHRALLKWSSKKDPRKKVREMDKSKVEKKWEGKRNRRKNKESNIFISIGDILLPKVMLNRFLIK